MRRSIRNNLVIGTGDKYGLIDGLAEYRFFSVSDCGGLAAAVVSERGPVGVDLQGGALLPDGRVERSGRPRPRVAEKYFSAGERELPFALVWARKEAYAKWLGTGLTHDSLAVDTCGLKFEEYDLAEYGWPGWYLALYEGE